MPEGLDRETVRSRGWTHHVSFSPPDFLRLVPDTSNILAFAWEFDRLPELSLEQRAAGEMSYRGWLELAHGIWTPSRYACQILQSEGIGEVQCVPAPIDTDFWSSDDEGVGSIGDEDHALLGVLCQRLQIRGGPFILEPEECQIPLTSILRERNPRLTFLYVANPNDCRKNLENTIQAFQAFHEQFPDSLLILKLTTQQSYREVRQVSFRRDMSQTMKFDSRGIYCVTESLSLRAFKKLMQACDNYLSPSRAEGQNLPLLEAMSLQRLVLSPDHTAMSDYIDRGNAIVLESRLAEVDQRTHHSSQFWGLKWYEVDSRAIYDGLLTAARLDDMKLNALTSNASATAADGYSNAAVARMTDRLLGCAS